MDRHWQHFHRLSGYATLFQLFLLIAMMVASAMFGPKPESVLEYFNLSNNSIVQSVLVGDVFLLVIMSIYFISFLSLYELLKDLNRPMVLLAVALTYISVIICIVSNKDFALIRLAGEYARAIGEAEKQMIEAAGKALFANNMFDCTAAYFSGIFMQGSGVIISMIMLQSPYFRKATAIFGIWGNGLDLLQHVLHLFLPGFSAIVLMIAGPGYIFWYIFLGVDFLRIAGKTVHD